MGEVATHCPLCGKELRWGRWKGLRLNTASLDRINNEQVIRRDNVWIICQECNSAKGSKTLEELLSWCRRVEKVLTKDVSYIH